jgi:hypothetical protein
MEDAGRYRLEMVYINCDKEIDVMFSQEIILTIFGETQILNQSKEVYGYENGFVTIKVDAVTPGATPTSPIFYQ